MRVSHLMEFHKEVRVIEKKVINCIEYKTIVMDDEIKKVLIINYSSYIQGSLNKFPDFFRMGTFIDSTHMKL